MLPLTERARDVIDLARREAAELRHDHVGTEHVLLGILREGGGIAARLSQTLHLKIPQIRKGVALLSPAKVQGWVSQSQLPFSEHLRQAIKTAESIAVSMNHADVGIGHLFLGMIENPGSKGSLLLINLGLDLKETHRELLESLSRQG